MVRVVVQFVIVTRLVESPYRTGRDKNQDGTRYTGDDVTRALVVAHKSIEIATEVGWNSSFQFTRVPRGVGSCRSARQG